MFFLVILLVIAGCILLLYTVLRLYHRVYWILLHNVNLLLDSIFDVCAKLIDLFSGQETIVASDRNSETIVET